MVPLQNDIVKILYWGKSNSFELLNKWLNCYGKDLRPLPEDIPTEEDFKFTFNLVYSDTLPGSSLRRFMVYLSAELITDRPFDHGGDLITNEMLHDNAKYLKTMKSERYGSSVEDFLMKEERMTERKGL